MRLSSIDIGSNAIRQIIVSVDDHYQWQILKKERFAIRLGRDVFKTKKIEGPTVELMVAAFKQFAINNKKFRVQKTMAVATSAMREAKNAEIIIKKIRQMSQIKIEVISGHQEADLIHKAIFKTRILSATNNVLLDIGGGSAEFTFVSISNRDDQYFKKIWSASFPLGVVRLMQQIEKTGKKLPELTQKYLGRIPLKILNERWPVMIGTGGNFDALAKLKLQLLKQGVQTNLTYNDLLQIKKIWAKLSLEEKLKLDIRKDRIDVLEYAIDLILISMRLLNTRQIKVPFVGLKEGVIHYLLE
jgi:exopolyphosphatase / guanosine-5'-triphosphate,3'-diphosphate pyrophosphatase